MLHVNKNTHDKYFKDAIFAGRPMRCYVDLGSSAVAVRQDAADELGVQYRRSQLRPLIGYGAGSVHPTGVLTAPLSIDGVEVLVEAHIVPNESQDVPLLVGHPYTEHPGVHILSTSTELRIALSVDDLVRDTAGPSGKTRLQAQKEQVIPSNYLGHITVSGTLSNRELCIEGGPRPMGALISRCIVETDSEGRTLIPILNVTGNDLTIRAGETVARGEHCEEREIRREVNEEPVTLDEIDTDAAGAEGQ